MFRTNTYIQFIRGEVYNNFILCNYHLRYFWGVSGKNSDGIILSLGFDLLLLSSMEFLYRVSFFMSGYHILIFFCRYAHIMFQEHMIYFCCTIVWLYELKFQPSAHLSTNHSTDLQSRLQSYPSISWIMSKVENILKGSLESM